MTSIAHPVTVSLEDLKKGDIPFETLQEAFGPESLGILVVTNVPPEFAQLRHSALSYASYLGNLPEDELAKLENPSSKYLTGWSLGKETLKNGQIDTHKGSYYANCAFYTNPHLSCAEPTSEFSRETFPEYLSPNIWPAPSVLPGFQDTMEALCRIVIDTAVLVARACDKFAARDIVGYPSGYLQHVVSTSPTTKARLLHYFPQPTVPPLSPRLEGQDSGGPKEEEEEEEDDWCATHLDHGCLTGLTSAMFIDESILDFPTVPSPVPEGGKLALLPELDVGSTDPRAGLYVKSRSGETVKVNIPRDCIAFQTGETLERITEGKFKAVPHFVRGCRPDKSGRRIARNTLAVFTQPNLGEVVDIKQGLNFGEFARGVVAKNTVSSG